MAATDRQTDRQRWDEIDKSDSRVARLETGRHITQTVLGKDMRARASSAARNVIDIYMAERGLI